MKNFQHIEITEDFKNALDLLENTHKNIFVTGRAGTGKSTLLEIFRSSTSKNVVILAPTGVAALNVRGQTIHSFFKFSPAVTVEDIKKIRDNFKASIYKNVETIVIDEISMVRADLLDCIDKFMRLNGRKRNKPFGGCQMVFFGDLYQLPPVVKREAKRMFSREGVYSSEYFFSAKSFDTADFEFVELNKIFRQHDETFIEVLNSIRNKTATEDHLKLINQRVNTEFEPPPDEYWIELTTTNADAEKINRSNLEKLRTKAKTFYGWVEGEVDRSSLPAEMEITLKKGAQVMLLNNNPYRLWVNGSVGIVEGFTKKEGGEYVKVRLENGNAVEVGPYTWEIYKYYYDREMKTINSETVGSFTQYPISLAWAITIHKSQGKTFDRVIIDLGRGTFVPGQVYVALSRCTSLDGVVLRKPLKKKHIFLDWKVVKFVTSFQYECSERKLSAEEKEELLKKAIEEGKPLKITYLKPDDQKSKRVIEPLFVGEFVFSGKSFKGVRGFCKLRGEERTFRLDRILEIEEV